MIVSVINQLLVAYTIQSAMGWVSGGANTHLQVSHSRYRLSAHGL
jgi:hypothetical protein